MHCFKALGLDDTTEFVYGSSFQLKRDYTDKVYKLATMTTLKELEEVWIKLVVMMIIQKWLV